jgi:putative alpha-1,2-mannosidase
MMWLRMIFTFLVICLALSGRGQVTGDVNVFLGTSGDHGQLSPGASSPFGMMDIAPQTYPNTHTGYEYKAKRFLGFTHNRVEGVGCQGSGGNLLIKPFSGTKDNELLKAKESASPGYYRVVFRNGISAEFAVWGRVGVEHYRFPKGKQGFFIDLSHALSNRFIAEEHQLKGNILSGWIQSGTTCRVGAYKVYYALSFDQPVHLQDSAAHTLTLYTKAADLNIRIAFSAVSAAYAEAALDRRTFAAVKAQAIRAWNRELGRLEVSGDAKEAKLFYSLLYRTMQSPYNLTEPDGAYRANDGSLQHTVGRAYNGWAIWDNYRTQLPLLSLIQPVRYRDMVSSIANLYRFGKKNWAARTEPSNTVRTEHAIVVLLDAYRKGYPVDFRAIRDSLLKESDQLDFSKPDKALESSYDTWAMAEILSILNEDSLSTVYRAKAGNWKNYWNKDFRDLGRPDVDKLEARGMYQGTIWQYRWFAPFDLQGLIAQCGGEEVYRKQLDEFFAKDYYNAANEPDIQAPYLYQATSRPWKSQEIIRRYARDTVIQYYYDENYRGIDPTIDRVYHNRPEAFVKSMDDDAGAMSAWYVLAACGLSPACVGWPVYYLHVPLLKTVTFRPPGQKPLLISVQHFNAKNRYIRSVRLNGKILDRNWLSQDEIRAGGRLVISASAGPNKKFGTRNPWITGLDQVQAMNDGPYVFYRGGHIVVKNVKGFCADSVIFPLKDKARQLLRVHIEHHPEWDFTVRLKDRIAEEPARSAGADKVFAVSDIEGEFVPFRNLLLAAGVIDDRYRWTFGKGSLIIAGDFFDRGRQVTPYLWLLYKLEEEAKAGGGSVHVVLGNHELMNLSGDFRYVRPEYFAGCRLMNETYAQLYAPGTELGRWLRSKNIIEKDGDLLVLHGGLAQEINRLGLPLEEINRLCRPYYDRPRKQITAESVRPFFSGATSPFWYRGYFLAPKATEAQVDSSLQLYGVKKILVGHDIIDHVSSLYGGKVIGLDVDEHQGTHEGLLIEGNRYYRLDEKRNKTEL